MWVEEQRKEATSTAVLLYTLFIGSCTLGVWLSRYQIAAITDKPDFAPVLGTLSVGGSCILAAQLYPEGSAASYRYKRNLHYRCCLGDGNNYFAAPRTADRMAGE